MSHSFRPRPHSPSRQAPVAWQRLAWLVRLFWVFLVLMGSPAWAASSGLVTPLEPNHHGLPLVKVQLQRRDGDRREALMLVDTGASISVLDQSVASCFWEADPASRGQAGWVRSASGAPVPAQAIRLHGIECGPISLQGPSAVRMDLGALNSTLEVPIAGIIGMNLLARQTFRVDFRGRAIQWGAGPEGAYVQELQIRDDRSAPTLRLEVAGRAIEATCDSGATGFLELSQADAQGLRQCTRSQANRRIIDLQGVQHQASFQMVSGQVRLGSRHWSEPEVQVGARNILGVQAMWPRVWFDFKNNRVGFSMGSDRGLESRPGDGQTF